MSPKRPLMARGRQSHFSGLFSWFCKCASAAFRMTLTTNAQNSLRRELQLTSAFRIGKSWVLQKLSKTAYTSWLWSKSSSGLAVTARRARVHDITKTTRCFFSTALTLKVRETLFYAGSVHGQMV
ncbi:hypothetical protein VTO42DRAFT_8680 [Malbranchea cinnamomea]